MLMDVFQGEMFNRILTRKKYICRSRALQIAMNLSALEEWVLQMGLPSGVQAHFAPVRDLLHWLQVSPLSFRREIKYAQHVYSACRQ